MIDPRLSHYRIIDQIDSGGMGVVYLAHDEHLDRNVAIKILSPGLLSDAAARKRFRKEALSLARLNHPNIATVHEFGTQNGSDFLVTEYIAGTNLDALITSGPVSSDEILRLGIQLAEGLGAAHQQGIVHRDLKPQNLRLTNDGVSIHGSNVRERAATHGKGSMRTATSAACVRRTNRDDLS